jgi:histone deacetylase complex regulatory component SIN3
VLQVAVLFKNHNDLLTQFTYFLPDNSPPQVMRQLQQLGFSAATPGVAGLLEQLQQLGLAAAAAAEAAAAEAAAMGTAATAAAAEEGMLDLWGWPGTRG